MINKQLLGKLRIYLPQGQRMSSEKFMGRFFKKAVWRELVVQAKKDGLMNATVYQSQIGFSNQSRIASHSLETADPGLHQCPELIDTPEKLQAFFNKHKYLLKDKIVIYKEVEHWAA